MIRSLLIRSAQFLSGDANQVGGNPDNVKHHHFKAKLDNMEQKIDSKIRAESGVESSPSGGPARPGFPCSPQNPKAANDCLC